MTTAIAHPNIALVKYWGKSDEAENLPGTPSLSITLDELRSETTVAFAEQDTLELNGEPSADPKLLNFLTELRDQFDLPTVKIESHNNFPTAAGLASSASGFAALMTALNAHCDLGLSAPELSAWARRGSGSAARSIYGGFCTLEAPSWQAQPLLEASEWPLSVVIAITQETKKATSSSVGMRTSAATSPYYPEWIASTPRDLEVAREAVQQRDFAGLAEISEHSCLKMHAVMQTTRPALLYWNSATVSCIQRIQALREAGLQVFFTIDAGPQVKAVCHPDAREEVAAALSEIPGVLRLLNTGLGEGARLVEPS